MSTLAHLQLALSERRIRRALKRAPQHVQVMPRISNDREVGDGGLTWVEVIVAAVGIAGWAVLCVVTL